MPAFAQTIRAVLTATLLTLVPVACATAPRQPAPGSAEPPAAGIVQVMILGSYHFANPGLDVVKYDVADVLSPAKQAEIEAIVEALSRFRPTRIAVERVPAEQARLDSLYGDYRDGRFELPRGEEYQLGFRLALRFDLPRLHPVDHPGEFPFQPVMAYAAAHDTAMLAWIQRSMAEIGARAQRQQQELSIPAILRYMNDPRTIAEGHGQYIVLSGIGAGDGYAGATLLARWYERNIRIHANLQRIVEPGDRVIFIVGGGHAAILRELVRHTPGMTLIEPLEYLPR